VKSFKPLDLEQRRLEKLFTGHTFAIEATRKTSQRFLEQLEALAAPLEYDDLSKYALTRRPFDERLRFLANL
jgi:hypothetical protein